MNPIMNQPNSLTGIPGMSQPSVQNGIPGMNQPSAQNGMPGMSGNLDLSKLERTFFCLGPVCLRSGVGLGLGVGCGAGIGTGWAAFALEPGASGTIMGFNPFNLISRLPGGYMLLDVIKNIQKQVPGAKTGAGCGVGLGYGAGIGLQYGPARSVFGGGGSMMNQPGGQMMNPQGGGFGGSTGYQNSNEYNNSGNMNRGSATPGAMTGKQGHPGAPSPETKSALVFILHTSLLTQDCFVFFSVSLLLLSLRTSVCCPVASSPAAPVPLPPPPPLKTEEMEKLEKIEKRLDEIDERLKISSRLEDIEKRLEKIRR